MKEIIIQCLEQAINTLKANGELPESVTPKIHVEPTKDQSHGDFASNLAMMLAKPAQKKPRDVADMIIANLPENDTIDKIDIAGPGFINFFVKQGMQFDVLKRILNEQENYGRSNVGAGEKAQVEFVSANPTGPLHVGHGRGAAYGSSVSDLLAAVGFDVHREYYVNDAGRQMDILAASSWVRYLQLCGEELPFPVNGYKGNYIMDDIAKPLFDDYGKDLYVSFADWSASLPKDETEGGDKEAYIDAVISAAKNVLGKEQYTIIFNKALNVVLDDIRDDLGEFNITFQEWFSEKSLSANNDVEEALAELDKRGYLYEQKGAIWFKSTEFGDDKDRVVKRDNGQTTYFASDIAYHANKFKRGFTKVINVWGADHHGYITRVKAALKALDYNAEQLEILLVQFAILYQGEQRLQMSTRSGSFVTLRDLRHDISNDAARFFYVTRKADQHMDFDLELAKSQTKDNPLYYIQYAHARICSMSRKAEQEFDLDIETGLSNTALLTLEQEVELAKALSKYPETVLSAALNYEPHQLTNYLKDLARDFHSYYNAHKTLTDDKALSEARLSLCLATAQVIRNGLELLGVSAPESM